MSMAGKKKLLSVHEASDGLGSAPVAEEGERAGDMLESSRFLPNVELLDVSFMARATGFRALTSILRLPSCTFHANVVRFMTSTICVNVISISVAGTP